MMTTTLTAAQATDDALAALLAAGFSRPGFAATNAVQVTSQPGAYPGTEAIVTIVKAAAPLTDIREVAQAVRSLPGLLQVSVANHHTAYVYRAKEA
jgi:hypothetical protein